MRTITDIIIDTAFVSIIVMIGFITVCVMTI